MDRQDSRLKFQQADALFRDGQYDSALTVLAELDAMHPDTRNILVPMAMCLERLGRGDEALPLCERVVRQFADTRARVMLQRLRMPRALPAIAVESLLSDHGYAGAYALPDFGPVTTVPVPEQSDDDASRWPMALLCGACGLMIMGLLLLPLLPTVEPGAAVTPAKSPGEAGIVAGAAMLVFAYAQAAGTLTAILALGALGKLPSSSLGGVVLDVGGTILIVNMISIVLGLLVMEADSPALAVLASAAQIAVLLGTFRFNYSLGWGHLVAFFMIYFVLTCVLMMLPFLAIFGAAGIWAFFMA